jgi:integrase
MARNFRNTMNRYTIPCIGHKVCEEMTMSDSLEFRAYVTKSTALKAISPHTVNRYLAMTRAVLGWGVNNDLIPFNPWAKLRMPREKPDPPDLLTVDELKRVLECAEPHCRWALDVAFNTGCRPGETELFKLKFTDVDREKGTILIRGTKTGPRQVNLKRDFLERLEARQKEAESEYVIEYNGAPLKQLRRSLKTALEKAGIKKKVRPYDIRHMYGTFMAKNGADIFAIKRLMGHSSLTTTERYLHHAEQLQKKAVGKLPSLGDGGGKSGLVPQIGPQTRKRRQENQATP